MTQNKTQVVCQNRKAHHDYQIQRTIEAGIVLKGCEVKSLRSGQAQLTDAFADFNKETLTLHHFHIPPYKYNTHESLDPLRPRTLLVHRKEAEKLHREVKQKGMALIPVKIYFKGPYAKAEIAIAKGKKKYDKRESLKKRDTDRELKRINKVI